MSAHTGPIDDTPALPLVDVSGFERGDGARAEVIRRVTAALSEEGFLYATGHGVDPRNLQQAFETMQLFFGRPQAFKDQFAYAGIDANFGYQGMAVERLDPAGKADRKETFTMRNALSLADRAELWPPGDFRDVALALYTSGLRAAYKLLEIVALQWSLPKDFFAGRHRGENVTLRFLHYPARAEDATNTQLAAGEHTDYGSITLLFQGDVSGLEVRRADGSWGAAPPVANAALVNTGDLMERWTNGIFRSTVHRVRPIAGERDRYSIALFVDPDAAVEVQCFASCVNGHRPSRYPSIAAGDYIRGKIAATHQGAL